ncbi:MAG: hypothetical protein ABL866_17040 [Devosia sp.]
MQAWQIFVQSVLRIVNNFEGALRVSAVLYLMIVALGLALQMLGIPDLSDRDQLKALLEAGRFPWIPFILIYLASAICALWIAVGWHRFILLDENPGIVPPLNGGRLFAYFLRGLLVGLILIPIYLVFVLLMFGLAVATRGNLPDIVLTLLPIAIVIPASMIFLRLSVALPGAALGAEGGILDTWEKTRGTMGTFLALTLILGAFGVAAGLVTLLFLNVPLLLMFWSYLYGWVSLMVGVSILTTLYGHYVEKRALT